jgi:hypothetical protein
MQGKIKGAVKEGDAFKSPFFDKIVKKKSSGNQKAKLENLDLNPDITKLETNASRLRRKMKRQNL